MARYYIMDLASAMNAVIAESNSSDPRSAIEAVPGTTKMPNRVAVIRTSSIEEFFVVEPVEGTPNLVVRGGGVVPGTDTTPPAAPTDLSVNITNGEVHLTWVPGGQEADLRGFMIYRDGEWIALVGTISFVDSGVEPGGEYVYDVHAMDSSNNKSQPATVTVTVPAA